MGKLLLRVYVVEVLALGAMAIAWAALELDLASVEWSPVIALATLAVFAQVLTVITPTRQRYRVALPFFLMATLLLELPLALLVVIVAFLPELARSDRPLSVRVFDTMTFVVAVTAGSLAYQYFTVFLPTVGLSASPPVAALIAAAAIGGTARAATSIHASLSIGRPILRAAVSPGEIVLIDLVLSCAGLVLYLLWQLNPWFVALGVPPIILLRRGLELPALREQATLDPKTGLINARALEETSLRVFEQARATGQSVAIIMADIDFMRQVNNAHGHLMGDAVLRQVARIIRSCVRDHDIAARFGGEEFCLVLPGADVREGLAVAERIRALVEAHEEPPPSGAGPIRLTISLGVAVFPYHGGDLFTVLHEADLATYRAKTMGRNCTCVALGARSESLAGSRPPGQPTTAETAAGTPRQPSDTPGSIALATGRSGPIARKPKISTFFSVLIAVTGPLLLGSLLIANLQPTAWAAAVPFVLAALLAEGAYFGRRKHEDLAFGLTPLLAGTLVVGLVAVPLCAAAIASLRVATRNESWNRWPFEFGLLIQVGLAAWGTFHIVAPSLTAQGWPQLVLAALATGAGVFVMDTLPRAQHIALSERSQVLLVWNETFRRHLAAYLAAAVVAYLVLLAYGVHGPVATLALLVPPVVSRLVERLHLDRRVKEQRFTIPYLQMKDDYDRTVLAFAAAVDAREHERSGHAERVAGYAVKIAEGLGLRGSQLADLRLGALLHDVGKVNLPDSLLRKRGPLCESEWEQIQSHPQVGLQMVRGIESLSGAAQVILSHHERYDGRGYPLGLEGPEIPLLARVLAVADAFDAMTSDRPFQAARTVEYALAEIERCSGSQFDPAIVECFLRMAPELAVTAPDLPREAGAAAPPQPKLADRKTVA